jgi:hypothetical protein
VLLLYRGPAPLLSLERTAAPSASASGWPGITPATLNGGGQRLREKGRSLAPKSS